MFGGVCDDAELSLRSCVLPVSESRSILMQRGLLSSDGRFCVGNESECCFSVHVSASTRARVVVLEADVSNFSEIRGPLEPPAVKIEVSQEKHDLKHRRAATSFGSFSFDRKYSTSCCSCGSRLGLGRPAPRKKYIRPPPLFAPQVHNDFLFNKKNRFRLWSR